MKYFCSLLLLLVLIMSCEDGELAFNPSDNNSLTVSIQSYGGSKNDAARSVTPTSDGGFIVLGHTQSNDGHITDKTDESFDYWLLKFDANANLQWQKTYGGSGDDRGRDILQAQDGGFVLLGYSDSNDGDISGNQGVRDFWLIKTDAQGNLSWQKSFGFSGTDEGISLIETSDNHLLLTGVLDVTASGGLGNIGKNSNRHAGGDYWAIKVDMTGTLVWSRFFGGSFTDTANGLVESSDGGFIYVGSSDSNDVDITNNKGSYDFWVVKSNPNGDMAWQKSFGGNEIDEARGIVKSNDGNYLIVGDTRSSDQDVTQNKGGADLWLVKISEAGELLWNRSIGGSSFDVPRGVTPSNDGGFLIAGSSRSSDGDVSKNQGQNDAWVMKINSSGQLLWQTTIGGSEIDFAYDIIELNNGTVIAVGQSGSNNGDLIQNSGFNDLIIIKLLIQ